MKYALPMSDLMLPCEPCGCVVSAGSDACGRAT